MKGAPREGSAWALSSEGPVVLLGVPSCHQVTLFLELKGSPPQEVDSFMEVSPPQTLTPLALLHLFVALAQRITVYKKIPSGPLTPAGPLCLWSFLSGRPEVGGGVHRSLPWAPQARPASVG